MDFESIKYYVDNSGDLAMLDEINKQLKDKEIREKIGKTKNLEEIDELLTMTYKMNYMVFCVETFEFADKYYADTQQLYYEIKIDLLEALGIDIDWLYGG